MHNPVVNPIMVEVKRGDAVESYHRGSAAIVNCSGEITASWGDINTPVYPRSSIKSMQAIPLVETGAADHFAVSDRELSIACSSHSSEKFHTDTIHGWLRRLGLTVSDLECGATGSIEKTTHEKLIINNVKLTAIHNNCSGKHSGFLTTALYKNETTANYIGAGHPVQKRIFNVIQELCDTDLNNAPAGVDGCGIPVIAIPLFAVALGFANMANPIKLTSSRSQAVKRILNAIVSNPMMIAGHRRFDTSVIDACSEVKKGPVILKTGAEGVYGAVLPFLGLGIALKIDDGALRASEVAMASILHSLGVFEGLSKRVIRDFRESIIMNASGNTVGVINAADCLRF